MLNILVVDDRADDALPLCRFLLQAGHRVNVAADGEAALKAEIADPPDVILLDLGLPKLDGFEVAIATRGVAWVRRPFIVAVSGHADVDYRKRAAAAGCDLYFVKPVDRKALLAALREFEVSRRGGPARRQMRPSCLAGCHFIRRRTRVGQI